MITFPLNFSLTLSSLRIANWEKFYSKGQIIFVSILSIHLLLPQLRSTLFQFHRGIPDSNILSLSSFNLFYINTIYLIILHYYLCFVMHVQRQNLTEFQFILSLLDLLFHYFSFFRSMETFTICIRQWL